MIDQKRLQLLISTAESMGLKPEYMDNVNLVSIEVAGKKHYLFPQASNPNSQTSSWLAKNKYLSRALFEQHGLLNIPYLYPATLSQAQAFLQEHKRIIVKPVKGKHSENIHLVSTEKELLELNLDGYILEKFIKGRETRFLVICGEVKAVHYKSYESEVNDPERTKRISLKKEQWDRGLVATAIKAADVLGLIFTAVDFLVAEDGTSFILEINSAPGIQRFQEPTQGPPFDVMRTYLELIVDPLKNAN